MSTRTDLAGRLKRAREEAGLTQQQVADWLGIRRPGVAEVEGGSRAVKSDELVRLAALYGRSLSWLVQGEMGPEERIGAALFRADSGDDPALHREAASLARRCALILELEKRLPEARAERAPDYSDEAALDDWSEAMLHGRSVAYQERARLGIGPSAPLRDPWGVVEDAGVRVFPLHLGDGHSIDGIFARLGDRHACVGVNVDKWVFRQVFSVVHEYGHALMDGDLTEACATSRGWSEKGSRYANRELRANQFAAVFLVPREALLRFLATRGRLTGDSRRPTSKDLSSIEVVRAQDHFGVSGDMLLWRLQNEGLINASKRKELRRDLTERGTQAIARSLGYDLRRFAQPFYRAHEMALKAYVSGEVSLGIAAQIFDLSKEQMREHLKDLGIHQRFEVGDSLVGSEA